MDTIKKIISIYYEKQDPRTEHLFMMSNPLPTFIITVFYALIVCYGPKIMKDREPFKLTNILIVYNFAITILSGYLVYEFLMSGWLFEYSLRCQPVDYSNSPSAIRMVNTCWVFFMTKFVELLDTVFFILRKKNNQLSFLHVFHHGCLPLNCWFALKYVAGGFGTFGCLLNSFIHFVMYFYYFLSAFGPKFQKYLWWKKYLTAMQMIQFITMILHGSQLLYIECNFPIEWAYMASSYVILFLFLFANFYVQEYIVRQRKRATDKAGKKQ